MFSGRMVRELMEARRRAAEEADAAEKLASSAAIAQHRQALLHDVVSICLTDVSGDPAV